MAKEERISIRGDTYVLSAAMKKAMLAHRWPWWMQARIHWATLDALERRGLLDDDYELTGKGISVKRALIQQQEMLDEGG